MFFYENSFITAACMLTLSIKSWLFKETRWAVNFYKTEIKTLFSVLLIEISVVIVHCMGNVLLARPGNQQQR